MHPLNRKQLIWLGLLLVVWALYGLTGRDAWKADEAIVLNGLLDWHAQADLFANGSAPIYTLAADLSAAYLAPWFDLQDGARVVSGLFALLAFLFTGLAARSLFGPGHEAAAVLALVGCLGLMLRAHALLPETAMLMGYALLLLGLSEARESFMRGTLILSAALICLALFRGWLDLAAGLLIVLVSMLSREWRTRSLRQALLAAVAITLLVIALLEALYAASAFSWWRMSLGFINNLRGTGALLADLAWVAWPVWPLALWAVWHDHRRLAREFTLHPVLVASVVLLLWAHWPAYSREGGLVLLLAPLSLLAAKGLVSLKRGAAQALYWFGVLTFVFFALLFWVYYLAIDWGWPSKAAAHMARLTPNYAPGSVGATTLIIAGVATLFWLVAIPLFPRAKVRPVLVWATGMTLSWILMFSLYRDWADAGWGYRPMLHAMAAQLPGDACLHAQVAPDVAAMLRYHLPERYRPGGSCAYWLVTGAPALLELDGKPLRLLWSGARPRQKRDVYSLYAVAPG
ncbi:MAG: hypothetical protein IPG66_13730 [Hydrogenophilales bacterium]|nr:hypothetical protein [Hydrogenophilales bacterium]